MIIELPILVIANQFEHLVGHAAYIDSQTALNISANAPSRTASPVFKYFYALGGSFGNADRAGVPVAGAVRRPLREDPLVDL